MTDDHLVPATTMRDDQQPDRRGSTAAPAEERPTRHEGDDRHEPSPGRRRLLQLAGVGALATAVGASGYVTLRPENTGQAARGADAVTPSSTASTDGPTTTTEQPAATAENAASPAGGGPVVEWSLPTSWTPSLPVLWGDTELFAARVAELTGGNFRITPSPAGEPIGAIEVLGAVTSGDVAAGSTASYYYIDQSPVLAFSTALPFGLTARQHTSWLYYGGGLELLRDYYATEMNVIQFPAGNTGAQMGGWFNREIGGLGDLNGLRMRIPGLGGRVMERLGVEVVTLGAGDILAALENDDIDAAEFVGPYDDLNLGLQQSAGFYYYPGFWEPGASFDLMVNLDAWNELPSAYQAAFRAAAFESVVRVTAEYDARNGAALNELVASGVELREFPPDVLEAGEAAAGIILDELAESDEQFAAILERWRAFRRQVRPWFSLAEAGSIR